MNERRPHGLGTVEPFRGRFRVRAPRDAHGKRATLGYCDTVDEGNKLLVGTAILKAEAGLGKGAAMTLCGYGSRFLDARESAGVRDMRSEKSRWALHIRTAPFAEWPMCNVEKSDVKEWLTELGKKMAADVRAKDPEKRQAVYRRKPRKLGAQSRKHCLNLLRMAFDAGIEDGHCTVNPCDGVDAPTVPKPPFDYLHIDEQNRIARCEKIDEADRLRAMFAWGTGVRQYDQWVMKLSDLRLDRAEPDMIILCHKNGPRKPPKRIRVQLFGVGLYAVKRWLELLPSYCEENERGLVWPLPSGAQRAKSKNYGWGALLKAAGIKRHILWHELRDTCASSLLMGWWGRKWTLVEVKGMLVHSSIEVTERYAHLDQSALAAAARETEAAQAIGPQIGPHPNAPISDSSTIPRRATRDSNAGPSASEAHGVSNDNAPIGPVVGQLWAKARALIAAEAAGDPRFARFALELAEGVIAAATAVAAPAPNVVALPVRRR